MPGSSQKLTRISEPCDVRLHHDPREQRTWPPTTSNLETYKTCSTVVFSRSQVRFYFTMVTLRSGRSVKNDTPTPKPPKAKAPKATTIAHKIIKNKTPKPPKKIDGRRRKNAKAPEPTAPPQAGRQGNRTSKKRLELPQLDST